MPKSKEMISDSDSESGSNSEQEAKQKSKPKKKEEKRKEKSSASEDSESEEDTKSKKRTKKSKDDKGSSKKAKKESNSESDGPWDIGNNKQVTVRSFKGKWLVDIREMYMDKNDGEMKPGKKGVSLNMDNWRKFMNVVEDVDKYVKSKC